MMLFKRTQSCSPKAALVFVAIIFLLAFWGITHFIFRYLGINSSSSLLNNEKMGILDNKSVESIKNIILEREQKRQNLDSFFSPLGLGSEEKKDPFNWQ